MSAADTTGVSDPANLPLPHSQAGAGARVTKFDRWLAALIQGRIADGPVRLELWDGELAAGAPPRAAGDLVVGDRRALIGLAVYPDLYFGEAYTAGRLGIRGALTEVVEALSRSAAAASSRTERLFGALARVNSISDARRNVHHHYDLGNDFYALWLDREMVYTCAYFADEMMSLDRAQRAKLDLVCRKLQLRPGESVVEAGCGWGALALFMAREYGVRVRAFNLSKEQLDWARSRARREGLEGRVEFIEDDYRNASGYFDVFVSVGMLEHVGVHHYRSLGNVIRRVLKPEGGRGLLHFIGRDRPRPLNAWTARRIFPGAYPPTVAEVMRYVLEPAQQSVHHLENLRPHYARTLFHWRERFERAEQQVRQRFGDAFFRAWHLYLASSEAAFVSGSLQLFQIVFAPGGTPRLYAAHECREIASAP